MTFPSRPIAMSSLAVRNSSHAEDSGVHASNGPYFFSSSLIKIELSTSYS